MSIDLLKLRARNLQGAIQGMFEHPVKLAQAYELIAKEDGYRNWDTACAAHKARGRSLSIVGDVRIDLRNPPLAAGESFIEHLIRANPRLELLLESLPARRNAIIVISGMTGSGKSTLLKEILGRSLKNNVVDVDKDRHEGNSGADDKKSFEAAIAAALRCSPSTVFIANINSEDRLQAATEAALTGTQVITTVYGQENITGRDLLLRPLKGGFSTQTLQELNFIDIVHLHLTRTA